MTNSMMRLLDQARATRLVMSSLSGDSLMFAHTLQETLDDDFGFGALGSLINVLRSLSDDLAGALVDAHGQETAEELVRVMLARFADTPDSPTDVGASE